MEHSFVRFHRIYKFVLYLLQHDSAFDMFQGANLAAATLEDTDLNGAKFTNANLEVHFFRMLFEMLLPYLYKLLKLNEWCHQGAYFSGSIADAADLTGADFTDALMPDFALKKLCVRTDISQANKKSGIVTKDSLFCP
jgi:uncharacterized protein YjbI with pentapeptide repeats